MKDIEKVKSLLMRSLKGRERMYSLLGRVYEKEVDKDLLSNLLNQREHLLKHKLIGDVDSNVEDGFEELYVYLNKLDSGKIDQALLELAVDYASLFLGVKYAREKKGIPHPSESVYLTGYLYQDERDQVLDMYVEEGLVKSPDFTEPEDHVALEMYFMAHLCRKAIKQLESGELENLKKTLYTQKKFLTEHILKWIPKLADDVIQNADTEFYKAFGKITRGFIRIEKEIIEKLIDYANLLIK